jgi:CubicO group peptidase (beta-lactamase class C family)
MASATRPSSGEFGCASLGRALVLALVAFCHSALGQSFEWQTATAESQDLSSAKLDALISDLAARRTRALVVIRHDRIVREWYADGVTAQSKQGTASLAKAIVGGLSLGVAISDGRIQLDDPAAKYIRQWQSDPQKSKITVRQLGSHTAGLSDSVTKGVKHEDQPGWKGEFWKRQPPPNDPFTIARDQTPLLFEPGQRFEYSNPGIGLLAWCVTAAIKDAEHRDIRSLLAERVYRPIGLADAEWSVGYGKTFEVEGLPLVGSWGGGSFTPRATARIGRLILREGNWDGRQILSRQAVRQITHDAGLPGHCGMGWWTNAARRYPWLPQDAVWGAGAGDQVLLVVPSLDLIVVRNGGNLATQDELRAARPKDVLEEFHDPRARILFQPIVEAIMGRAASAAPYPPSPVIARIDWAPADTIVRKAKGSDNWPLTWADDDHQYTAYGDGNGFEPRLPEKLGLGLARVSGGPEDFAGTNLRAAEIENKGQGPAGQKASGMLMVDGVLYLWARNAGNSRLARSADHGQTWTWADWKFTTSFGCPTFLNFGKNYAGARDDFVYVYSQDADSAYQPADRMVLARVPKDKLIAREAYEFFVRLDSEQKPVWTRSIDERGAVFEHPGRCYRSAITYSAGLKRYLWVQILPGTQGERTDTRFAGGFAIFDAPEPWGPWTTAFYTEKWDVGPGETASLPTKWMSADGRTMWLVFSGEDHFSLRKANLKLHSEDADMSRPR